MTARSLCCLIVAEGPDDPSGRVAAVVPFHGSGEGEGGDGRRAVALSCSGVVLPGGDDPSGVSLVAAPLSLLSPFLRAQGGGRSAVAAFIRDGGSSNTLRSGDVLLRVLLPQSPKDGGSSSAGRHRWEPAQVAGVARLPACAAALRTALSRLRATDQARWRLGWSLGPAPPSADSDDEAAADEAAAFLVLRIGVGGDKGAGERAARPSLCHCCPSSLRPASPVAAWGAPFGALAPFHFAGSAVAGCVSGALGPPPLSSSSPPAVLRIDVAALPGMEGGPVACGRCGQLCAVLSRPLARFGGGGGTTAEVPLAFPAALLLEACLPFLSTGAATEHLVHTRGAAAAAAAPCATVERALTRGVVMVRRGRGSWATGVVMPRRLTTPPEREGEGSAASAPVLVLTIAHLFDQAAKTEGEKEEQDEARVRVTCPSTGAHAWSAPCLLLHRFCSPHLDCAVLAVPYPASATGDEARLLRAGLDALNPLELLLPSPPSLDRPPLPVVVAGHGLFGPALGWPAAATAGSLARLVTAAAASSIAPPPVMALTTATVHAGASGAAALCALTGRLAAMATSNSRHVLPAGGGGRRGGGGGSVGPTTTTLPRWNYAVPAAALRPLWAWAEEEQRKGGGRTQRPLDDGAPFVQRARAALREMDARATAEGGEAAARVWALLPPASADVAEQPGGRRRSKL